MEKQLTAFWVRIFIAFCLVFSGSMQAAEQKNFQKKIVTEEIIYVDEDGNELSAEDIELIKSKNSKPSRPSVEEHEDQLGIS